MEKSSVFLMISCLAVAMVGGGFGMAGFGATVLTPPVNNYGPYQSFNYTNPPADIYTCSVVTILVTQNVPAYFLNLTLDRSVRVDLIMLKHNGSIQLNIDSYYNLSINGQSETTWNSYLSANANPNRWYTGSTVLLPNGTGMEAQFYTGFATPNPPVNFTIVIGYTTYL